MNTQDQILGSAAELFATRGYQGTSVREITDHAGANVAAVHYHFGSKEGLLRALTDAVIGPLNARRSELLEELRSKDGTPAIDEVLRAFIRPDIEAMRRAAERTPAAARFLGRVYSDGEPWIREMAAEQFGAVGTAFAPVLAAALPDVEPEELSWRLRQVVAVIVNLFATYPDEGYTDAEAEQMLDRVVAFLAPAMAAPTPARR